VRTVVLDSGHGGPDTGATGIYGLREADVNWSVTSHLFDELLRQSSSPLRILPTHLGHGRTLQGRVWVANDLGADLFVSLHCNSFTDPGPHGFEVWTHPGQNVADLVAERCYDLVLARFPSLVGRRDWSDGDSDKETRRLFVLRETAMPALLIEMGFVSNPGDAALLAVPAKHRPMAAAIATAILEVTQ